MITSDDLTWMRADAANTLPDTCNLLTETRTSDSAGGWTSTWGTAGTAIACRFDPANIGAGGATLTEQAAAGRETMVYDYRVTLPYNAALAVNMRLEHNNLTYEIRQFSGDESWPIVTKVYVSRLV